MNQQSATGQVEVWKRSSAVLVLCTLILSSVHSETLASIVSIWYRSETFAHGFLILPISLYLLWQKRRELLSLMPRPDYRGLLALVVLGIGWLVADAVDVLVVQQYLVVAMVPALVWTVMGWQVVRAAAFPLGFLLFGVPVGEALIPPMMRFTATFAVTALKLTGVPVYWEGLFLNLTNGTWSIVEGCSGVRYLIASVTLGFLYAYLSYRSYWRRALFVTLSFIVPVFANGVRAYLIIMIGYLSDMRLAAGVDHLIYGWVFFGIVMLLLFWVGSFWREEDIEIERVQKAESDESDGGAGGKLRFALAGVAAVIAVVFWPAWSIHADRRAQGTEVEVELSLPSEIASWQAASESLTAWRPRYIGMDYELDANYENEAGKVALYVPYYLVQSQGKELVNSQNVMIRQKHPVWRETNSRGHFVRLGDRELKVTESFVSSSEQNLLIWHWYWVGHRHTSNPYLAKILEATSRLAGGVTDGAGIVVYSAYALNPQEARDRLERFLEVLLPLLEKELLSAAVSERL